jgi:hypothetical protein
MLQSPLRASGSRPDITALHGLAIWVPFLLLATCGDVASVKVQYICISGAGAGLQLSSRQIAAPCCIRWNRRVVVAVTDVFLVCSVHRLRPQKSHRSDQTASMSLQLKAKSTGSCPTSHQPLAKRSQIVHHLRKVESISLCVLLHVHCTLLHPQQHHDKAQSTPQRPACQCQPPRA